MQIFRKKHREMRAVFFFLILRLLSQRKVFKRGRFSLINLDSFMGWQKLVATRVIRKKGVNGASRVDGFYDEFFERSYMSKYRKKKEFYLRFVDERTDEQKKQEAELKAWAKKYRKTVKSEEGPVEYLFSFEGLVKELWRIKVKKKVKLIKFKYFCFKKLVKTSSVWNVKLRDQFRKKLTSFYPVRYTDTSINKFLTHDRIKKMKIFFLRKNRIFNKGRYSRSRQLYRTGVYMCIYINIAVVYGLYFIFYRFSFNFGYVWFIFALFVGSLIFSRILKYRFYNPRTVVDEFFRFMVWAGFLIKILTRGFNEFVRDVIMYYKSSILCNMKMGPNPTGISGLLVRLARWFFSKFSFRFFKKKSAAAHFFFWKTMTGPDNSRFKWRSISYPFIQLFRCLIH